MFPSTENTLITSIVAEVLRNEKRTWKDWMKPTSSGHQGNSLPKESLTYADLTLLNQCFLNPVSISKKQLHVYLILPSLSSPDQLQSPLLTLQFYKRHSAHIHTSTVFCMICLPPQWALSNTSQVEVIELCQNEYHLEGKRKKKKVSFRLCNNT